MPAATARILSRTDRRRATGVLLLVGLWLKVCVVALALAQPAQAADGPGSADRNLLAALQVICTSTGAKVMGSSGGDGPADPRDAGMDLIDCARCCCAPTHGMPAPPAECAVGVAFSVGVLIPPRSPAAPQAVDGTLHPRAPPAQVLA